MPKNSKSTPRPAETVAADLAKVNAQRDDLKAKAVELAAELDVSTAFEKGVADLADMTPATRAGLEAALAQNIAPPSTENPSTVGNVGANN